MLSELGIDEPGNLGRHLGARTGEPFADAIGIEVTMANKNGGLLVPGVDIIAIVKSGVEESQLGQPGQGAPRAGLVVAELETPRHARLIAPDDQIKVVRPEPPAPRLTARPAEFVDFVQCTHQSENLAET